MPPADTLTRRINLVKVSVIISSYTTIEDINISGSLPKFHGNGSSNALILDNSTVGCIHVQDVEKPSKRFPDRRTVLCFTEPNSVTGIQSVAQCAKCIRTGSGINVLAMFVEEVKRL